MRIATRLTLLFVLLTLLVALTIGWFAVDDELASPVRDPR